MPHIQLPAFVPSTMEIKSENLSKLFGELDILDYLRKVYIENNTYFFDLMDELKLRGIAFSSESSNDLFPHEVLEEPYLLVKQSGNKFKKLNFDLLGLNYFLHRFSVVDDTFFDYIPLAGFYKLNKALNLQMIADVFSEAGFLIIDEDNEGRDRRNPDMAQVISESQEDLRLIKDVFSDRKYLSFLRYCSKNSLEFISEIQKKHIENYRHFYGVGVKRYNAFLMKWESVMKGEDDIGGVKDTEPLFQSLSYGFKNSIPIREAFSSIEYQSFVAYCEREKITLVDELHPMILESYSKEKGIGRKKVDLVSRKIESLLEEEEKYLEAMNQPISIIPIYPLLINFSIGDLVKVLNLAQPKLTDEQLDSKIQFIDNMPKTERDAIFKELISLKPLNGIADELKETISERELEVLNLRSNPLETLESIGSKIGVTRERVRQIINKSTRKLLYQSISMDIVKTLKLMKWGRFGLTEEAIKKSLNADNFFLLTVLKELAEDFHFIPELKLYVTKEEHVLFTTLLNELESLPKILSVEDFKSNINEIINNQVDSETEKELTDYLLTFSSRQRFGNYISRTSIPIVKKLEIIFQHHLEEPLLLNEYGKIKLDGLSEELFGGSTETSLRAIEGRIRDIEKVILIDNLTFQWIDESLLEDGIFEEIEIFINQQLELKTHINAEDIFKKFEDQLNALGIHNKLHIYSLIKYLFDDQYIIGKGNTLNIYRNGMSLYSLDEKLEKTLSEATKDYTIAEIAEKLNYKKSTIDLTISKSSKYVTWDDDRVKLISSLGITEEERIQLENFIEPYMSEGFSTTFRLFQECQFDNAMSVFLQDHEIQTDYVLGSVIKKLIPSIKGHTVFLYDERSEVTSFDEAIKIQFPEQTTRKEISDYILSYGYSTAAAYQMLHALIKKRDYVWIDTDKLFNRSSLGIDQETKESVRVYLEMQLNGKDYLIVSELIGFRRKLPTIKYRWTPQLIHTLALELGFKHIKSVDDYRYDRLIIVGKDSLIHTFDEIVYKELTENYEGPLHEIEVAKHLKALGLLWSDERLPFELLNSKFFKIDEFGRMKIGGNDNGTQ